MSRSAAKTPVRCRGRNSATEHFLVHIIVTLIRYFEEEGKPEAGSVLIPEAQRLMTEHKRANPACQELALDVKAICPSFPLPDDPEA